MRGTGCPDNMRNAVPIALLSLKMSKGHYGIIFQNGPFGFLPKTRVELRNILSTSRDIGLQPYHWLGNGPKYLMSWLSLFAIMLVPSPFLICGLITGMRHESHTHTHTPAYTYLDSIRIHRHTNT